MIIVVTPDGEGVSDDREVSHGEFDSLIAFPSVFWHCIAY